MSLTILGLIKVGSVKFT